jgi:CheY-like chemotaxis protein
MPHLLWADPAGDRMFIEAALNTADRPSVEFVSDGEELLQRCAACPPDMIVLDLDLPRVSGLDVLAELRLRRNTVPVVVFSRAARPPTAEACRVLGVKEVIAKPSDFREFRQGVQRIQALSNR